MHFFVCQAVFLVCTEISLRLSKEQLNDIAILKVGGLSFYNIEVSKNCDNIWYFIFIYFFFY